MYGKIIGAMVGGSLGMLLAWSAPLAVTLALLGAAAGHFLLDQDPEQPRVALADWPRQQRPAPSPVVAVPHALIDAMCPLFIELARIDGMVSRLEVRVIREFFEQHSKLDSTAIEAVRVALKAQLRHAPRDLDLVIPPARQQTDASKRQQVARWMYELALVDGPLTNSETNALKRIVDAFELNEQQRREIAQQFLGTGAEHYVTLGVPATATDDEVRSAYRRLAAENHPDRVATPAAAERFRQVQQAYEALKRIRGF